MPREVVLVEGDLDLTGGLQDSFHARDEWSYTIVLGNVHARHVVNGSAMYIHGDLTVDEILFCNSWGADTLEVRRTISATLVVQLAHDIVAHHLHAEHTLRTGQEKTQLGSLLRGPWKERLTARGLYRGLLEELGQATPVLEGDRHARAQGLPSPSMTSAR
jgi:hypothetical protein